MIRIVDILEQQKANLKNMKTNSLEDISKKLELLHGYEDQIAAVKESYNNSQMLHSLDEAIERGEKIAEEAKKSAPKTPEERRKEMVEEATGVEQSQGMLSEMLDELSEITEDISETPEENLEETLEETEEELSVEMPDKYQRIDLRI
ncbi:MAG: hypothetical protein IJ567_07035 [Lachnospiraceae bacterium]|nr:hypothetical protein [Lachnospiraceae bacterium]